MKITKETQKLAREKGWTKKSSSQTELQKWLREEHNIFIDIQTDATVAPRYCMSIKRFFGNPKSLSQREWGWETFNINLADFGYYRVYEECLERALQLALNFYKI
jgi:predicted transcriptional regulator